MLYHTRTITNGSLCYGEQIYVFMHLNERTGGIMTCNRTTRHCILELGVFEDALRVSSPMLTVDLYEFPILGGHILLVFQP